jgi:hypothetical protein
MACYIAVLRDPENGMLIPVRLFEKIEKRRRTEKGTG